MIRQGRIRCWLEAIEGVLVLATTVVTWPISRRWLRNWGSRADERSREWQGDRIASPDRQTCTRGITIACPAEAIWPWVIQLGLGRAGFYSYELIERLGGIPVTNIVSIEPALQGLAIGDEIKLHPKAPGLVVADLLPPRRLCFHTRPSDGGAAQSDEPVRSWSIYIEPVTTGSCRLLLRSCSHPPGRGWRKGLAAPAEAALDFVMEQRMLRSIRRLAELHRGGLVLRER